jgi:antitoxin VapB
MKRANVLQQDSHQIIKLPRSLRINSQQVFIKQVGNALVLIPSENPWQSLFDSLENFSDDSWNELMDFMLQSFSSHAKPVESR